MRKCLDGQLVRVQYTKSKIVGNVAQQLTSKIVRAILCAKSKAYTPLPKQDAYPRALCYNSGARESLQYLRAFPEIIESEIGRIRDGRRWAARRSEPT